VKKLKSPLSLILCMQTKKEELRDFLLVIQMENLFTVHIQTFPKGMALPIYMLFKDFQVALVNFKIHLADF